MSSACSWTPIDSDEADATDSRWRSSETLSVARGSSSSDLDRWNAEITDSCRRWNHIKYLTTQIELVLPTLKSWTVHKIIQYLMLGLLSSLWNIYHSTTAYFFDHPVHHQWGLTLVHVERCRIQHYTGDRSERVNGCWRAVYACRWASDWHFDVEGRTAGRNTCRRGRDGKHQGTVGYTIHPVQQGTKVRRYNRHGAGSLHGLAAISSAKI